jgi:GH3 auxin-responsive promoter
MIKWPPLSSVTGSPPARAAVNAGFHVFSSRRVKHVARLDTEIQRRTLLGLTARAAMTRFGRDHDFDTIRSVDEFQRRVPLRTFEDLWKSYLEPRYPIFDNLKWPGRIPYIALTSGTTTGVTKYIPVSHAMVRSNQKAAKTMIAAFLHARPKSRLFHGRGQRLARRAGLPRAPQPAAPKLREFRVPMPLSSSPGSRRRDAYRNRAASPHWYGVRPSGWSLTWRASRRRQEISCVAGRGREKLNPVQGARTSSTAKAPIQRADHGGCSVARLLLPPRRMAC